MNDWQPVVELESLLDALENELLSATDEEIRDALGRRQPTRIATLAIFDAIAAPDTTGISSTMTSLQALDRATSFASRPRANAEH